MSLAGDLTTGQRLAAAAERYTDLERRQAVIDAERAQLEDEMRRILAVGSSRGSAASDSNGTAPNPGTRVLVRQFAEERGDEWWSLREAKDYLVANGWTTTAKIPIKNVRNEVRALVERGELESRATGVNNANAFRQARGTNGAEDRPLSQPSTLGDGEG